jgi:hypothetical protein
MPKLNIAPSFCRASAVFMLFCLIFATAAAQQEPPYRIVTPLELLIHAKVKLVADNKDRQVTQLTQSDFADLPVGIANEINGVQYVIAIDSAYSIETGWFFSAYASIKLPGSDRPLAFMAKDIGFHEKGLAADFKLGLVSAPSIELGQYITMEFPTMFQGKNYVVFGCNGFKSASLAGNFIFSKELLVPDQSIAKNVEKVVSSFEILTSNMNDILLNVSITPFQIPDVKDITFDVKRIVVDLSDLKNPAGLTLPKEYQEIYGSNINLWRGFYIEESSVHLKSFTKKDSKVVIAAKGLVLDDMGVTGAISATNLLTLETGSIGEWPFSIDKIGLTFQVNSLTGGELNGTVGIPFLGSEGMPYEAMVAQGDQELLYRFLVATSENKEFNTPFSAKVVLNRSSAFIIENKPDGFVASTKLNGTIQVMKGELNSTMSTSKLNFEGLVLRSTKPYLVAGTFSTEGKEDTSENRFSGFPLTLDNIGLSITEQEILLRFRVGIRLSDNDGGGFAAKTSLEIIVREGQQQNPNQKTSYWQFDRIRVQDIALDVKTSGVQFYGKIAFYDKDPMYGKGFRGLIAMTVGGGFMKGIKVNAYFGSVEEYRYWHVDGYMAVSDIQIVPPYPVYINGFMGGVSYKMKPKQPPSFDFSKLNTAPKETKDITKTMFDPATQSQLEAYDHGEYVPDKGAGMSFMAGVTLYAVQVNVFNADARLEISFNAGGGLRYIQFDCNGYFFTPVDSRERVNGSNPPPKSIAYGISRTLFDNVNKVFHSNLKVYVDVFGIIKGTGPQNLMGESVIHFDRNDWYIYMGRPSAMDGLDFLGLAKFQSYFMMGTKVEPMAPPPSEMLEIFQTIDMGIMRDETAIASGRGFATGHRFRVGFDSGRKLRPFYVRLAIGAGADIMLRNFGNAYCAGRNGSLGMNGWYASGQAYTYLIGQVGIRVKGKDFDIVYLGAGALLQAQLPNPTWLSGRLAGRYRLLGGLIKGRFHLKLSIGDPCELINPGEEIDDIIVIADIKPEVGTTDASVFSAPQVSFNTAINTEFKMMDTQDRINSYRIKLQEFTVSSKGSPVSGTIEWNPTNDVAILRTSEILPPQSELKGFVKVFWEKKPTNGVWEVIKDVKGQVIFETKETSFTTGTAPSFIPEENISYSYPAKGQYNFHVNEYGTAYIKLQAGQSYLFQKSEGDIKWNYHAKFQDVRKSTIEVPLTYEPSKATITFTIPASLTKETIYNLTLLKRPETSGGIDQNVSRTDVAVNAGEDNEMTRASNTLEGTIAQDVEKEIYASIFRTSRFGKFEEKWNSFSKDQDVFDVAQGNVAVIGKRGSIQETFDEFELVGNRANQSKPLIQIAASPDNAWLREDVTPYLYENYPIAPGVSIGWRRPVETLGLKPVRAVRLENDLGEYKLTDENIASGAATKAGTVLVGYYLSYYCFWDFNELTNKAVAKYLNNWAGAPPAAKKLLSLQGYRDLRSGNYYPVDIVYSLPGIDQVTYRNQISIKF